MKKTGAIWNIFGTRSRWNLLVLGVSKGKESGCFYTFLTRTPECMMVPFIDVGRNMFVRAREYGIQFRDMFNVIFKWRC